LTPEQTGVLTGGGLGVLLDVTALADEAVLGLDASEAALGLGAELGAEALGGAGELALRVHCCGYAVVGDSVRCGGVYGSIQVQLKDEAIGPLLAELRWLV
jgi:hypothetical protein